MIQGVDISEWNAITDYCALARAVDFAYLKRCDARIIGAKWVPFIDRKADEHAAGLRAGGKPTGDYCFGHPSMDPLVLADFFSSCGLSDQLRPVIDMESTLQGHTPPSAGPWARAFIDRLETNTGTRAIIYAGPYYSADMLRQCPELGVEDLWLAEYPGLHVAPDHVPAPPKGWTGRVLAWQWSGSESMPGVFGNVDRDVAPSIDGLMVSV